MDTAAKISTVQTVWPLLAVDDLASSLAFWRDQLGFQLVAQAKSDAGQMFWCRLERGGSSIMLQTAEEAEDGPANERGRGVTLYFVCDDVEVLFEEVSARGLRADPPTLAPYGMRQLFVPEPNGYFICFESPAESLADATRDFGASRTMATLHLICGLPCSGKTTLAKTLELELPALRLCPDEWITQLYGPDISGEALDAARDPVEQALWDVAARVLVLGVDVILEYGFWSRGEREAFRRRAAQLGARSELHFTDTSEEELLDRLARRNAALPVGTFRIDERRLREWIGLFEAPGPAELRPRDLDVHTQR